MKRIISVLICVVLCLGVLSACGGEKQLNETPVADMLTFINERYYNNGNDMVIIEDIDMLELYYSIDPADVEAFAAETTANSATEVDEIVIVKAVDEAAAERVAEKLELRMEAQRNLCASYSPELVALVDGCEVRVQGVLVTMIVSEDFEEIAAFCDETMFS